MKTLLFAHFDYVYWQKQMNNNNKISIKTQKSMFAQWNHTTISDAYIFIAKYPSKAIELLSAIFISRLPRGSSENN